MEIHTDDAVLWEADGLWYAQELHEGKQVGVIEDGSTAMSAYLWLKRALYIGSEQYGPGKKWLTVHQEYLAGIVHMYQTIEIARGH